MSLAHCEVPVQWAHYRSSPSPTVTYFVGVRANGQVLSEIFWTLQEEVAHPHNVQILNRKILQI